MAFSVNICMASGRILRLSDLRPRDTVLYLKTWIFWNWGYLQDQQRLFFLNRILEDGATLFQCNIGPEDWIDLYIAAPVAAPVDDDVMGSATESSSSASDVD